MLKRIQNQKMLPPGLTVLACTLQFTKCTQRARSSSSSGRDQITKISKSDPPVMLKQIQIQKNLPPSLTVLACKQQSPICTQRARSSSSRADPPIMFKLMIEQKVLKFERVFEIVNLNQTPIPYLSVFYRTQVPS